MSTFALFLDEIFESRTSKSILFLATYISAVIISIIILIYQEASYGTGWDTTNWLQLGIAFIFWVMWGLYLFLAGFGMFIYFYPMFLALMWVH